MAQKNPEALDNVSAAEAAQKELERLATEQGVQPITALASLRADFWPEDENIDEFIHQMRERRRSGR